MELELGGSALAVPQVTSTPAKAGAQLERSQ
ncbi:hypothetical protein C8J42_10327 [Sphingomonas sp. PP-CE-1A-559]|nr:hypothetical protein C8J42_10327 [Sphingomonas sp. PP-CE-1A-559]